MSEEIYSNSDDTDPQAFYVRSDQQKTSYNKSHPKQYEACQKKNNFDRKYRGQQSQYQEVLNKYKPGHNHPDQCTQIEHMNNAPPAEHLDMGNRIVVDLSPVTY